MSDLQAPPPTMEECQAALRSCLLALSRMGSYRDGTGDMLAIAEGAWSRALSCMPETSVSFKTFLLERADHLDTFVTQRLAELENDPAGLRKFGCRVDDREIDAAERRAQEQAEHRKLTLWNARAGKRAPGDMAVSE